MNRPLEAKQPATSPEELNDLIIDSITDIKGKHIVKLDLRQLDDAPTEYFIICEGDSTTQIRAIADNVHSRVKKELGVMPSHLEGKQNAKWICVDYFNTVVHVFYPESRHFYGLEELWADAFVTEYDTL